MKRCRPACVFAFAMAFASLGSAADAGDPLASPACRAAMDRLAAREARLGAAASAPGAQNARDAQEAQAALAAARREAARVCLGQPDRPATPPQHLAQPPVGVPSSMPALPPPPAPRPAPAAVPARPAAPPVSVVGCDASGCWASDGSRLQRSGANLVGPRGICTLQGTTLHCP